MRMRVKREVFEHLVRKRRTPSDSELIPLLGDVLLFFLSSNRKAVREEEEKKSVIYQLRKSNRPSAVLSADPGPNDRTASHMYERLLSAGSCRC